MIYRAGIEANLRGFAERECDLRITEEAVSSRPGFRSDEIRAKQSASLPKGSPSVHLDVLRGFAAFSVLLAHWRDAFFVDYVAVPHHNFLMTLAYFVTGLGHQWVIVFFVMSGYLVGGSVLRSVKAGRWSWKRYLQDRLTRLYIVLIPALLLGGAIDWVGMHMEGTQALYNGQSGMHALSINVHSTLTLPAFLGNCFFLQTISLPGMHGALVPLFGSNGPLWSLSNEFWYYLAFPPLVLMLVRGGSWRARAVYGVVLLVWGWFVGAKIALLGLPWLMGVLITLLPPFPASRPWVRRMAMASALVLLGAALALVKSHETLLSYLVLGSIVTFLIWVTLHCATAPLPALYVKVAHRAARSSYTLYLVHLPMLILLKAWLHVPRQIPSWHLFTIAVTLLLMILVYAQLVYELFEKNTERVRNSITPLLFRERALVQK